MRTSTVLLLCRHAVFLALIWSACQSHGRPLAIAANTADSSYDPVSGVVYSEMRTGLIRDFPGTTFTSLPVLAGDLSGFDLVILNRFNSQDLQPAEQSAIHSYVLQGGSLLYVGEGVGNPNDTFTLPFGISMDTDPSTQMPLVFAPYSNPGHPFFHGPFGVPSNRPSGSYAAQVITLGPSVELARWVGGGVAISAFERNTLAADAGFGLFLTDVNMMTPNRFLKEVSAVLSNALATLPGVIQPILEITPATGGVTLTWDALAIGWTLQTSDNLSSWSDIGTVITASGSYTDTSGGPRRFFRLAK